MGTTTRILRDSYSGSPLLKGRSIAAEIWYDQCVGDTDGDIQKDLWILREYAQRVDNVLELGVRDGVSTVAFLAAAPWRLVSVDIDPCQEAQKLLNIAPSTTTWTFIQGDSRAFSYPVGFMPDLTFIDTKHTYPQLLAELQVHAQNTKKYIILHDTLSFGLQGEDGSSPGLIAAYREYIRTNTEWREELISFAQNGLTVLSRRS